jgi:DNA polymerase I-like protein with 3'-5' exonuclease and polymerase domains
MARADEPEIDALRFKAKAANFSLVFNTSAFAFAKESIEPDWSFEECKNYIALNDLERNRLWLANTLGDTGKNKGKFSDEENDRFSYFWAVANDIKKKFFEKYKGVETWIEQSIESSKKNGYIRSPFGAVRRLPQLLYQGVHTEQSEYKNLCNISCNAPVQNYEAVLMMRSIVGLVNELRNKGMQSKVVGNVHDSCVLYIHDNELHTIMAMIKKYFEEDIPENQGVPMEAELKVADYAKGEVWGFGHKVKL